MVELEALRKRLDDPELRAEEVSQILGQAVALSIKRDGGLQRSFYPIVERALKISITKNPGILATSLAPIIGDAVRKAVANAFRGMAESINFLMERSLSWESVKWRLEALRTGKSFGEIALLRSLRYKVQQVVLIQRETGSVLQYVKAPGEGIKEAELVSSMLTALGDFMTDSFNAKRSQELEAVDIGDFKLWVHHGPQALLAATILGTPPPELKNVFARENELIHQEFAGALASFSGDASIFDGARPHLQNCLLGQTRSAAEAVALVAGRAGGGAHRRRWRSGFLGKSPEQPLERNTWQGFRASRESWSPARRSVGDTTSSRACAIRWRRTRCKLAAEFGIAPGSLEAHFEPYQSLDPAFRTCRASSSRRSSNWSSRWYCSR